MKPHQLRGAIGILLLVCVFISGLALLYSWKAAVATFLFTYILSGLVMASLADTPPKHFWFGVVLTWGAIVFLSDKAIEEGMKQ